VAKVDTNYQIDPKTLYRGCMRLVGLLQQLPTTLQHVTTTSATMIDHMPTRTDDFRGEGGGIEKPNTYRDRIGNLSVTENRNYLKLLFVFWGFT